jgi:hypothetical protein
MMRHRQPTLFQRCLAVHVAAADRRDSRQPRTVLGKIGHLITGIVLGAVVAAVVIVWVTGAQQ